MSEYGGFNSKTLIYINDIHATHSNTFSIQSYSGTKCEIVNQSKWYMPLTQQLSWNKVPEKDVMSYSIHDTAMLVQNVCGMAQKGMGRMD